MKTRLVPIGNSRGVRIPKPMIAEARLEERVEISVRDHSIIITSARIPREGWADAARQLHEAGEDALLDPPTGTTFDGTEWDW